MVQDIGAMAGFYYTPNALQVLYEQTAGHPQITREICNELVELVEHRLKATRTSSSQTQPYVVESRDILDATAYFLKEHETLHSMYKELEPFEQVIIEQLAIDGEMLTGDLSHVLAAYNSDPQDFRNTLHKLQKYGLIQDGNPASDDDTSTEDGRSADDETPMVRLTMGLFRRYLYGGDRRSHNQEKKK